MPPEETSYELTSAETLVVRLFGVLESIVLFQFIALQGLMLTGRVGDFGGASTLEMLVSLWLVGIVIYFMLPGARRRSTSWRLARRANIT